MMIDNLTYSSGLDNIQLHWNSPKYRPNVYKVFYTCKVHDEEYYYRYSKLERVDSSSISFKILGLKLRSVCFVTLFSVYNQASLDRGLRITVETLQTHKNSRK